MPASALEVFRLIARAFAGFLIDSLLMLTPIFGTPSTIFGATEELNMSIEPKIVDGVPKIGVSISRESIKNPAKALAMSLNTSKADAGIVISGLGQLLSGKVSPKEGLMGPIGMANLSNRVSS